MLESSTDINIIDRHGKIIDSFSSEIFKNVSSHVYPRTISLVNHYYFSRKHKAVRENRKNRSEVSGGGRKPWRQKGLNRARQGSIRSPQWVGGGVCFGPGGEKKYLPNTNKVCRRKALLTMLVEKRYNKQLLILDRLELNEYKTKEARFFLNNLKLTSSKVLIVLPVINVNGEENQKYLVRSFRNLDGVSIINSDSLIVPNLLSCDRTIILTRDSFREVEKRVLLEKKVSKKSSFFRSSLHNKFSEEKIS